MYEYRAVITKVYDGDTLTADIDLGFKMCAKKIKLRLLGINTPEIRSKDESEKVAARKARDRVRELCLDKDVVVTSHKKGKYGRWLASVRLEDGTDLADLLLAEHHGVPYGV